MANRRGKYLLTQRRKAALHKAQVASAKKRRGRRRRVVAGLGAGAGILAVVGTGHYIHKVAKGGPKAPVLATTTSTPVAVVPHRPPVATQPKVLKIAPRYRDPVSRKPLPMHKIKKRAAKREAARIKKNDKRRMQYWSGRSAQAGKLKAYDRPGATGIPRKPKKVGGTPRKNARKTPQERMAEKERQRTINKMVQKDRRLAQKDRINNVKSLDAHRRKKS